MTTNEPVLRLEQQTTHFDDSMKYASIVVS